MLSFLNGLILGLNALLWNPQPANAAVLGQIPTITIGGRVFTDLANLKVISCYMNGNAGPYCTPREPAGSAGYTPSGSNRFRVLALRARAGAGGPMYIARYADNDVGHASVTPATNPVYIAGQLENSILVTLPASTDNTYKETITDFYINNTKYGYCSNQGNTTDGTCWLYGYEVP